MTIYYLYVKTHNITGLKYLGQTKRNPHTYLGSGTTWTTHLRANGNDISTAVLLSTTCVTERNHWGRYYSNLYRITTAMDDYGNRIWANRIPETGGGAGRKLGSYTLQERNKISERQSGEHNSAKTPESRAKRTGVNHWTKQEKHKGYTHPMKKEENKLKVSAALTGRPSPLKGTRRTQEVCDAISSALTGVPKTEKHILRIKETHVGFTGKKCTDQHKEKISNKRMTQPKIVCEHCNKEVDLGNYKGYHGDKCKVKTGVGKYIPLCECEHCGIQCSPTNYSRWHGPKCKKAT